LFPSNENNLNLNGCCGESWRTEEATEQAYEQGESDVVKREKRELLSCVAEFGREELKKNEARKNPKRKS